MIRQRRSQAAALILSVATLSMLLVLAVVLARLMAVERTSASLQAEEVRVRLAAEGGVERALAEIRTLAATRSYDRFDDPWVYHGEDFDGDGRRSASSEDSFANGDFDTRTCPVEYALRPSFVRIDPSANRPVMVGDSAVSTVVDEPDGRRMVTVLKVLDSASELDVNGGMDDADYALRVARMIDLVWDQITKGSLRVPRATGIGKWLLDRRPPGGYSGERQVRDTLARIVKDDPATGLEIYRRLGPYLACHPWRDSTVLRPRRETTRTSPARYLLRYDTPLALATRAPVNLNTAPVEVLYACLAGIRGWAFQEGVLYHLDPYSGLPDLSAGDPGEASRQDRYESVEIPDELARQVASEIVAFRRASGGFCDWADFDRFLADLVSRKMLTLRQADLVHAQAVPDSDLNKFDPDAVIYRAVDKSDLVEHGPEFCLSSMGNFEIECEARSYGATGSLLATAKVLVTARAYDVVRDTTIRDFMAGSWHPTGLAVYPEREFAREFTYDGQLGLATLGPTFSREPALHASFDMNDTDWREKMEAQGQEEKVDLPRPGPLLGVSDLGTVFRGGAYSEEGLYPRFSAQAGYLSDKNGAIAFWFKPNWNIVSAAPRPHAVVDLNGQPPDSTFQIYNDTQPPDATSKGLPRHYLKFLAWDIGNNRSAEIRIPLEDVMGPREWFHVCVWWDGIQIVMWVRGTGSAGGYVDVSRYSFALGTLEFRPGDGGGWTVVPTGRPFDLTDFYRTEGPTPPSGSGQFIPWPPGNPPTFPTEESFIYWMDSLVTGRSDMAGAEEGSTLSADYDNENVGGGNGPGAFRRSGYPTLTGYANYFASSPIRFGFEEDPTAACRFGGRLKVRKKESNDPDKPPHYEHVVAPSNGTYGDLVTFGGVKPGDATIDDLLKGLFLQGRYYKAGDAWFESRDLGVQPGARLGTVSWRIAQPAGMPGVRVTVAQKPFESPSESAIHAAVPAGGLRYRLEFLASAPVDEPLLETPYVDSVTITVLSPIVFESFEFDTDPVPQPWQG